MHKNTKNCDNNYITCNEMKRADTNPMEERVDVGLSGSRST